MQVFNPQWQDLPVFHLLEPALDSMGVYDHDRVKRFQSRGWQCHISNWSDPFLWKTLDDGREIRIHSNRVFLKTQTWFAITVIDQYGREVGQQYYTFPL